jgi:hypothetical protein
VAATHLKEPGPSSSYGECDRHRAGAGVLAGRRRPILLLPAGGPLHRAEQHRLSHRRQAHPRAPVAAGTAGAAVATKAAIRAGSRGHARAAIESRPTERSCGSGPQRVRIRCREGWGHPRTHALATGMGVAVIRDIRVRTLLPCTSRRAGKAGRGARIDLQPLTSPDATRAETPMGTICRRGHGQSGFGWAADGHGAEYIVAAGPGSN